VECFKVPRQAWWKNRHSASLVMLEKEWILISIGVMLSEEPKKTSDV
jgi:hypothetical protein